MAFYSQRSWCFSHKWREENKQVFPLQFMTETPAVLAWCFAVHIPLNILAAGYSRYSLLGWSDGGITALILANNNPELVDGMVVWGSNSYVTKEDMAMIEVSRDISKWNPRMRDPLEGRHIFL